jgi:anti-anti-sigma regulatory factor
MASLPKPVVHIIPDDDGDCTGGMRRALALVEGDVTLDLSRVRYLTAAALGELARLRKRLRAKRIVLLDPSPLALRTLNVVGFNAIFEFAFERAA